MEVLKKPQFFPKRFPKRLRQTYNTGHMVRRARHIYEFGPFRLIPDERQLLRGDEPVPLTGKPFDLLHALVKNSGRLISKGELMELVWPDASVEEANLSVNMTAVRRALDLVQGLLSCGLGPIDRPRMIAERLPGVGCPCKSFCDRRREPASTPSWRP